VLCIAAKFQNIPLGNPHVFQQFPGGMGQAARPFATQLDRKAGNRLVESQMCAATIKKVQHLFADSLVGIHQIPPS
jgi:hypothetical protein